MMPPGRQAPNRVRTASGSWAKPVMTVMPILRAICSRSASSAVWRLAVWELAARGRDSASSVYAWAISAESRGR
jgi:hypothetical protein